MRYFLRSFRYLRPYWKAATGMMAVLILTSLLGLLSPWPLQILVDHVLGKESLPPFLAAVLGPLAEDRTRLMLVAVLGGLLVAFLESAFGILDEYLQTNVEQRMVLDFRSDLFQHAQRLSMAFHDRRQSGMLIYAINSQGDAVASLVMIVPGLMQSLITLVGMFWIVFAMNRTLAVLSLVVLPFLAYSVRYYSTRVQKRLEMVRELEGQSLSIIHEAISMLRVIVAFGREDHEHRRFRTQGMRAVQERIKLTVRQTYFSLLVNMATASGTALVLGVGAYQALHGRLTVGHLLVVMSYVAAVYSPLESLTYAVGSIQQTFVQMRASLKLLDTQPEVRDPPSPVHMERARGNLSFERVGFHYQGRVDTLKEISFDAAAGQVIGIVGPTGAGKTTLASLIPRFYDVQQGRILLDGQDIRDLSLRSLRDQISLVLQEPLLFSGTIADNIRYGRLDASFEEIVESARAANAHDFIMQLPKKYETELGERGAQVSGGERQRICVARAFLRDAPILILDEPTSSIDSKTEAVILEALERLIVGRTTLMIAHRLSTLYRADHVLVLNHGRLVEQGTPDELLSRDGLYRQLYELQTRSAQRGREAALRDNGEAG